MHFYYVIFVWGEIEVAAILTKKSCYDRKNCIFCCGSQVFATPDLVRNLSSVSSCHSKEGCYVTRSWLRKLSLTIEFYFKNHYRKEDPLFCLIYNEKEKQQIRTRFVTSHGKQRWRQFCGERASSSRSWPFLWPPRPCTRLKKERTRAQAPAQSSFHLSLIFPWV